jgi:hypothetical protein
MGAIIPFKPNFADPSFLEPIVAELLELEKGVHNVFNAYTRTMFVLAAFLLVSMQDLPGSKLVTNMKGPSGKAHCRMCAMLGVLVGTKYWPCLLAPKEDTLKTNEKESLKTTTRPPDGYDPFNLPMRTQKDYEETLQKMYGLPAKELDKLQMETGWNLNSVTAIIPR